jgi:hypothetical protein
MLTALVGLMVLGSVYYRLGHDAQIDQSGVEQPGRYRNGEGHLLGPESDLVHDEQRQGEHPHYRKVEGHAFLPIRNP